VLLGQEIHYLELKRGVEGGQGFLGFAILEF